MLKLVDICLALTDACVFIVNVFNISWNIHTHTQSDSLQIQFRKLINFKCLPKVFIINQ